MDISPLELAAVAFAVLYLVFAIRQLVWCWPAALISVSLSLLLFIDARLYMQSALQVFYFAMGVYGWYEWVRGGESGKGVVVHWWSVKAHAASLAAIVVAGLAFGWFLSATDAALPYLDSIVTVGAIVATFMLARKVIENWVYFFIVDAASIYLYLDRDLALYAGLFVVYLILIVFGFRSWLKDWRQHVEASRG